MWWPFYFALLCYALFFSDFFLILWTKTFISQFNEDPSFKPQGGRLGENDMDYDTDEKTMAALRRHLRKAREQYYRYRRYIHSTILELS